MYSYFNKKTRERERKRKKIKEMYENLNDL